MRFSAAGPEHPGAYVRESVIPQGMSVSEAARRLGVGRPALSTFLNGRSALSLEMAVRLSKAFGADIKRLNDMQLAWERAKLPDIEKGLAVRLYMPNPLTIRARQIKGWACDCIEARTRLPVLIRMLVHSTASDPADLKRVDFPGYDHGERRGPDGIVDSSAATPWVPEGESIWELSTRTDVKRKAREDYRARCRSIDPECRSRTTLVLVTARNWQGKDEWAASKAAMGHWKAVRVYDSSDIEQWLEQSFPAQVWLAGQLGLPEIDHDFETLDRAWCRWAGATEPPLSPQLFAPWIDDGRKRFKEWSDSQDRSPFIVGADSPDAALAFLKCMLDHDDLLRCKDRTAVLKSGKAAARVVSSLVPLLAVSSSLAIGREAVAFQHPVRHVICLPRNALETKPHVFLSRIGSRAFKHALEGMSIGAGRIDRLARESGRSLTVLRRRLSPVPVLHQPEWARDRQHSVALLPLALAGSWRSRSKSDQVALTLLADVEDEALEADFSELLRLEDSPVWSVREYRGVTSVVDCLFATAPQVTPQLLDRFLEIAEYVLSESDPALELPESQQWAAALHGRARDHSEAFRKGLCESLILLALHGKELFGDRLDKDVAAAVESVVRSLLEPLQLDRLLSLGDCLPRLAEAAPKAFLSVVEDDLNRDSPVVLGLLKPLSDDAPFQPAKRIPLLHALECLAWNPKHLHRASLILAWLAEREVEDSSVETPTASLQELLKAWRPQTAADLPQRVSTLRLLLERHPLVGWRIGLDQLQNHLQRAADTCRPLWSGKDVGSGNGVPQEERLAFVRATVGLMLARPDHDERTLADLLDHLASMSQEERTKVWELIGQWSTEAGPEAKAALRDRIRRTALTLRGRLRTLAEPTVDRARQVCAALRPSDPVLRCSWLFASHWIEVPMDGDGPGDFDAEENNRRLDELRRRALTEIGATGSQVGLLRLLTASASPYTVGRYLVAHLADSRGQVDFIHRCLFMDQETRGKAEECLKGFLPEVPQESLRLAAERISGKQCARLLCLAPFRRSTWSIAESCGQDASSRYWKRVVPPQVLHSRTDIAKLVDELLDAQRPRAAFHSVSSQFRNVDTARLRRLLTDVATVDCEPREQFRLQRHDVAAAVASLASRRGVTPEEVARVEFRYLEALLDHGDGHGIPNLESCLARSPAMFAELVTLCTKRSDAGEDPPEWRIEGRDRRDAIASRAFRLLKGLETIPGTDESGEICAEALGSWLREARRRCQQNAREVVGDQFLGELLSHAPAAGSSDAWPCEAVCAAMESIASREVAKGFVVGTLGSRGPVWRGRGGAQERALAKKYDAWSENSPDRFPFVRRVLDEIAEEYRRIGEWWDANDELADRELC